MANGRLIVTAAAIIVMTVGCGNGVRQVYRRQLESWPEVEPDEVDRSRMAVAQVTSETFREEVLESELPVVVDFYAGWCRPCHQIAPILNALSEDHEGVVRFAKVNIDEEPELASAYRVSSIPAVLLFDSGVPTAWSLGPKPGYVLERELGLGRLAKRAKRRTGPAETSDGHEPQSGAMAALRSWWGSR